MARSDLVDIIFTITGCSKPPSLPLREELNSNGFEIVYNAKGVCEEAVAAKEKKEALLEKIKTIEYKLENKKSYRRSKKKMKALNTIREIKAKLEAADTAVDSKTYLDQLSRVAPAKTVSTEEENTEKMNYTETFEDKQSLIQISFQSCKEEDVSLKGFEIDEQEVLSLASINHDDIEDDISKVLECMDEDECISSDDESSDSFTLDSNLIKEQFESDLNPGNIVVGNHSSSSRKNNDFDYNTTESKESDDDNVSVKWEHVNIDTRFENKRATPRNPGIESITYYYTSPDAGPTKSKTVRFKNVKPTTEEALDKCRALTQQVRIMQLSFSMENNSVDSSTVFSDEGFEAIIAKASDDVMLDRLLEFSIDDDMDRSHASTLSLTDDQFEDDDSITDSCESTFAKIPVTKCQILAEKRNEFRKNMKKQGMEENGNQILYKGYQRGSHD